MQLNKTKQEKKQKQKQKKKHQITNQSKMKEIN